MKKNMATMLTDTTRIVGRLNAKGIPLSEESRAAIAAMIRIASAHCRESRKLFGDPRRRQTMTRDPDPFHWTA